MSNRLIVLFLLFCTLHAFGEEKDSNDGVVFVTTADTEYFPLLMIQLRSINKYHSHNLRKIAIFDLGFTDFERAELAAMNKVQVYDIEQVNDQMFTHFRTRPTKQGKPVRGLYTWKPAVMKHALEMFPYFFYLDAGVSIRACLDPLFDVLRREGSFLVSCDHTIRAMCTEIARHIFSLDISERMIILDQPGLSSGIKGLSRSVLKDYIMPVYALASDIHNFSDDGTAPKGFGWGRHDQLLFSIQAQLLGLKIHPSTERYPVRVGNKEATIKLRNFFSLKPKWWTDAHD